MVLGLIDEILDSSKIEAGKWNARLFLTQYITDGLQGLFTKL
jgi:hypothetical protein